MKRFFRMLIQNLRTGERRTYISARQGSAPAGWKCIGVLGYYEQPSRND